MEDSIAVMQPYLFPYIGYFQLVSAVDTFVIYDDVTFIKGGWIARNSILSQNGFLQITAPVSKASSNKLILDHKLVEGQAWKKKMMKQILQNYTKSPYLKEVLGTLEQIIDFETDDLSTYLLNSITQISNYLEINTQIIETSRIYDNKGLDKMERLVDICRSENKSNYVNSVGGQALYTKEKFKEEGVNLFFLETESIEYTQFKNKFIPNLSIIDVMMFNSVESIQKMLAQYSLI